MDNQIARGKRSIIVDANLFLAFDPGNTKGYPRYSYDGILHDRRESTVMTTPIPTDGKN